MRRTGLDRYVADWVISEEAGVSKPNPRIFALAAERARMRLRGAWVIGDSPEADIGGAAAAGATQRLAAPGPDLDGRPVCAEPPWTGYRRGRRSHGRPLSPKRGVGAPQQATTSPK